MNNNPLISICISAYNTVNHIGTTIESLINQTYSNLEIIIIDNNSQDKTYDIIKKYAEIDNRIKHFKNDTNIGYPRSVNKAVEFASSEYIALYHADDIYDRTIIAKQLYILQNKENCSAVFTLLNNFHKEKNMHRVFKNFRIFKKLEKESYYNSRTNTFDINKENIDDIFLSKGNFFACPTFMTKKSVFNSLGGFTPKYPANEDLELWIKYLLADKKISIINETLLFHRLWENYGTFLWSKYTRISNYFKVIDEMMDPFNTIYNKKLLVAYNKKKAMGYLYAAINALKVKKIVLYKYNIKKSFESYSYKISSLNGIFQRFPFVYRFYLDLINKIKAIFF